MFYTASMSFRILNYILYFNTLEQKTIILDLITLTTFLKFFKHFIISYSPQITNFYLPINLIILQAKMLLYFNQSVIIYNKLIELNSSVFI